MKKKMIILGLILTFLFAQMTYGATSGEKLQDLGILSGDVSGDLLEDQDMTRAALASLLMKLDQTTDSSSDVTSLEFEDINQDEWYSQAIAYVTQKGWMSGVEEKTFDPNGTVSQEMAATILLRILGYEPVWGQAVADAENLGMSIYVEDETALTRGEVFNYVYEALYQKLKDSDETLASAFGISLKTLEDNRYGYSLDTTEGSRIIDLDGNVIYDTQRLYTLTAFADVTDYSYVDENGVEKTYVFAYNDRRLILLDMDNPKYEKQAQRFQLDDGSGIYEATPNYYIVYDSAGRHTVYDWAGNVLLEEEDENKAFNAEIIDSRYIEITDYVWDESTSYFTASDSYIYDTETNSDIESLELGTSIQKITDDLWLYSYPLDSYVYTYTFVDMTDNTRTNFYSYEDGIAGNIYWPYGSKYGLIEYTDTALEEEVDSYSSYSDSIVKTEIIDMDMNVIFTTNNYVYDYIEDSQGNLFFETYDLETGAYGLLDSDGATVFDEDYGYIGYDEEYQEWYVYTDNAYIYYNEQFQQIAEESPYDTYDDSDYSEYLPDGKLVYNYGSADGYAILLDSDGNVIKTFSEASLEYNQLQGVLIGDQGVYDLDGNTIEAFDGYDTYFNFFDEYIGLIKDGETTIVDRNGQIIYGPYDGSYIFYEE